MRSKTFLYNLIFSQRDVPYCPWVALKIPPLNFLLLNYRAKMVTAQLESRNGSICKILQKGPYITLGMKDQKGEF